MYKNSGYSKVIVLVVFLASVAAPLNQFKVPPMMQQLMAALDISLATSGWLMSVFALVGVVLALPVGMVMQRLGLKNTGLVALATLLVGSCLGMFSSGATLMLASRVIEGAGMCLMSVMAPAAIAAWFPPEKRGLPMGIWAAWVPLGAILMFNIAPALGNMGWKAVWAFTALYTAVVFIMMLVLFRMPRPEEVNLSIPADSARHTDSVAPGVSKSPYNNINIWMLGLVFLLFNIMVLSVNTFMPIFLESTQGFTGAKASSATSMAMVAALIMGPVAGIVIGLINSYKKVLIFGLFLAMSMAFLIFNTSGAAIYVVLLLMGTTMGMVPTSVLSGAPEIMKNPGATGIGMSIVMFGQNTGMFIGPALTGSIIENHGWATAGYMLGPILLIAALIAFFIKMK